MAVVCSPCKLCGHETIYRFSGKLVRGFEARYFECTNCQMLQSFHLDGLSQSEVSALYKSTCRTDLDPGAAWRQYCLVRRIEAMVALGLMPSRHVRLKVLDFGCGSGFVVDFLRRRFGWGVVGYDPYAEISTFAADAVTREWPAVVQAGPYDLVIASEVLEHLVQPREQLLTLAEVMAEDFSIAYSTTGLYVPGLRDQSWAYLAPHSAQHVCFYSRRSLKEVGQLLKASKICQVGAENEWLFARGLASQNKLIRLRFALAPCLLQKAVRLGLTPKIE